MNTPLCVVTWNVRYFGHGTKGLRATQSGVDAVARALAELPALPDIVALQEVETSSLRGGLDEAPQLERLCRALEVELAKRGRARRYHALYYPAHRYEMPWLPIYTTGLAVLVGEPLEVEAHNTDAPWDITFRRFATTAKVKQTRVCAHARVRLPGGRRLDVFNTHLSLPAFLTRDLPRLPWKMGFGHNQLAEIETLLGRIDAVATGPAVLVGDFNSIPGSPAYEAVLAHGRFTDAFRETVAQGDAEAWTTNGIWNLKMHVDHVFSTEQVRWLDFDGCHAFGVPGRFDGISDHVPKIGRLVVGTSA